MKEIHLLVKLAFPASKFNLVDHYKELVVA